MTYQSKKHKEVFDKAMVKKNENNYKLIAVIYLLTADNTLWNLAKEAVKKNAVDFDSIKLNAIHPKGYTLYCAAKDIYLGTRHLTVSDLIDMNLVTPKLFGVKKKKLLKTEQRYRTKGGKSSLLYKLL